MIDNKIHVLQIVRDPMGGIRKHIHSIIRNLDYNKFAHSYIFAPTGQDNRFLSDISSMQDRLIGTLSLPIADKPGISDISNIATIAEYVRNKKVDIIHGHGAKGGLYARIVSKMCGIKSVYTPHGGAIHKMFAPIPDFIYTTAEKILYPMTDYFIFESKYTSEGYRIKTGKSPANSIINYNSIEIPDIIAVKEQAQVLGYSKKEGEIHIGVVGMLRPQKGQKYAIEAISELMKRSNNIHLHIFGGGTDRGSLEDLSRQLNISEHVTFHGDVQNIEPHIYNMDIILIPSLFESFGYVALEAITLGKWVIASDVGGLKEIIINDETGLLIPPADIAAIADAIEISIKQNRLHPDMGKSQLILEKFSMNKMITNIEKIYSTLCS